MEPPETTPGNENINLRSSNGANPQTREYRSSSVSPHVPVVYRARSVQITEIGGVFYLFLCSFFCALLVLCPLTNDLNRG
jgi:hypothetical protein